MTLAEKAKPRPETAETDESRSDEEDAVEFGFSVSSIRAVRLDLGRFKGMHERGSFEHYDGIRRRLTVIRKTLSENTDWLCTEMSSLSDPCREHYEVEKLMEDLSSAIRRIGMIEDVLPKKAGDLRFLAAKYLLAAWNDEPLPKGYAGTREIRLAFKDDTTKEPKHPSMRFVCRMLKRTGDATFMGISKSTIARAKRKMGPNIPKPSELLPFKGNPDLMDWY